MIKQAQHAAIEDLARRHRWRLVLLFGSAARRGEGRDMDLAVLPERTPDLMTQGRWLRQLEAILEPHPVDLLVLQPGTSPLVRFEALRDGICLYESEAGRFEREQDRAFFLHADAMLLQRHSEEVPDGA